MSDPRHEVLDFASFAAAPRAWDELVLASDVPLPFLSHTWLRSWWRHFGAGLEFRAWVARDGAGLRAAAPLALRRVRSPLGTVTVAEVVGTGAVPTRGMGLADRVTLPVRRGDDAAREGLCRALVDSLGREVDVLDLKGLASDGPTLPALASAVGPHARCWTRPRSSSPFLPLPASWDEYLASRSGNFRKHLRKYRRRLDAAGEARLVRPPGSSDPASWLGPVLAVDAASWKARRGTNLFRHPALRAFFVELFGELASREELDVELLEVNGEPVAYELCFDWGNRLFSYNSGFRSEYAELSPGTLVTAAVLEAACARGRTEYDLLRGDEGYKARWSSQARSEVRLIVAAERARARAYARVALDLRARLQQVGWMTRLADRASGLATRWRHGP